MPSPMDECTDITNIDPTPSNDSTPLKRKLDSSSLEELPFPCKKVVISPIPKLLSSDVLPVQTITSTQPAHSAATENGAGNQIKLSKVEREWLKAEKAKEKELERIKRDQEKEQEKLKREQDRLKKEEEKQKREEERLKRVNSPCVGLVLMVASGAR